MLAETHKLDVRSIEPDGSVRLFLVAEAGEWDRGEVLQDLQEKLNSYLDYVLDGQLAQDAPRTAGRPVSLVLSSVDEVPPAALPAIRRMQDAAARYELPLSIERVVVDRAA